MSIQHQLLEMIYADPWKLFCAECSQKMKVMMAIPAQKGREARTYECVCGHSERINVVLQRRRAAPRRLRRPLGATKAVIDDSARNDPDDEAS